jgi:hypothetical protein
MHLKNKYFVYVMTYKLQDQKYFRWFDSGDLPNMDALDGSIVGIYPIWTH